VIGDETGIVRIQLPQNNPAVKEGVVLIITNVNVEVDPTDHKLTLRLTEEGFCERTTMKLKKIDIANDKSEMEWQSDE
jgi:hypothetical protein